MVPEAALLPLVCYQTVVLYSSDKHIVQLDNTAGIIASLFQ